MTALIVWSVIATIGFAWCGIGWWLSHGVLRDMGDVSVEDWPLVRNLIRTRIAPPSTTREDR